MSGSVVGPDSYDVAVIGAGLVGAAVSFDLVAAGARVVVFETENDIAAGASRSNSGILHTGFDSKPGSFETSMILAQNARWPAVFDRLGIPYRHAGALLIARSPSEADALDGVVENARGNGVDVERIGAAELATLEPGSPGVAAVRIPGESITDPYEVVRRLLSVGQTVRLGSRVESVASDASNDVILQVDDRKVRVRFAVNCAGLFADMFASQEFRITPRRGEFLVYPPSAAPLVRHILLPLPNRETKGVLVFPTLSGHVCVGPTAVDQTDKTDWRPDPVALAMLRERAAEVVPALADIAPVDAWAGLRPCGHPHNYLIQFSEQVPHVLHVAGIRSTGLSACLGISDHVVSLLAARGLPVVSRLIASNVDAAGSRPWWQRLNSLRNISVPL